MKALRTFLFLALLVGVVTSTPSRVFAAVRVTPTVQWGAETNDPWLQFGELNAFEKAAKKKVSLYLFYANLSASSHFPTDQAQAIAARGVTPVVTAEPWELSMADVASGAYDATLRTWAAEAKAFGKPLWFRFAHEMNGDWYPWADPANYVAAYRHVHDVFASAGVTNVKWVWSPNVVYPGSTPLADVFPGDGYVDWIGIDGYNFGTSQSWSTWQSPTGVFDTTLKAVRALSSDPIAITETGSAESGGSKARWITDFFALLKANPDVKAFLWFNLNKETDWRIQSSPAAQTAFASGISDGRFATS